MRRADIYGQVWGGEMKHRDRSVDVFVRKVRNKLARAAPELGLHPYPLRGRLPLRRHASWATRCPRRWSGRRQPPPDQRRRSRPYPSSLLLAPGTLSKAQRNGSGWETGTEPAKPPLVPLL